MENSSKPAKKLAGLPVWAWVIILPIWVYGVFLLVQMVLGFITGLLLDIGVPLLAVNQVVLVSLLSLVAYGLTIVLVVWLPYRWWRVRTTRKELGVPDYPVWMDIFLSIPAYVVYMITSGVVMLIAVNLIPGINTAQAQELPFSQTMLVQSWQYILAFLVMVVLAPLAEELLYRGYLYGKLRHISSAVVTILVTSVAFGAAHLWTGGDGPLQWAVAIDTMVLSVMLCVLREYTGAIWAGTLVHMIKNGVAFYLLFINPDIIDQIRSAVIPLL